MKRSGFKARTKPLAQVSAKRATILSGTEGKARKPLPLSTKRMKQGRSTGKPTVEEAARFDASARIPCLACLQNFANGLPMTNLPVESHHILSGGRRLGHLFTIRLCQHHHQAVPLPGMGKKAMVEQYGPTLCDQKRAFTATYGQELDLLATQNEMLKGHAKPDPSPF